MKISDISEIILKWVMIFIRIFFINIAETKGEVMQFFTLESGNAMKGKINPVIFFFTPSNFTDEMI